MTERLLLAGIRVLDVGSYVAGPAAATVMADFGADVFKIEPLDGDPYRQLAHPKGTPAPIHNPFWVQDARSKRSLAIDLKDARGRAALLAMVAQCDVFITNYRPQLLEKLQLRWEDLSALNPRLIYGSITGYGERGPDAGTPGFDTTSWWARSGLMDYVRWPGTAPAVSSPGMGDHATAMAMFGGIMAAMFDRERTGRGTKVSTSLLANGVWSHSMAVSSVLCGIPLPPRNVPAAQRGNPLLLPHASSDGHWLMLTLLNEDKEWGNLLAALDAEDIAADARYVDASARRDNAANLQDALAAAFARFTRDELTLRLQRKQVTFGWATPTNELPDDPQLHAADILTPMAQGERAGLTHLVNSPLWIEGAAKAPPRYAPNIGEHSAEVLLEFGIAQQVVSEMIRDGVVGCVASDAATP